MYYLDKNGNKVKEFFPTRNYRIGDIDDMWITNNGNKDYTGTINYSGKLFTYNQFVSYIKQIIPDIDNTPHYIGKLGLTLYSKDYKSTEYEQFSTTGNTQIYLNENAPDVDIARVFYHEICHAVYKLKGLKHSHTDRSALLENEIAARENEAEKHYNQYFK